MSLNYYKVISRNIPTIEKINPKFPSSSQGEEGGRAGTALRLPVPVPARQ
jgi:hypothetical protein